MKRSAILDADVREVAWVGEVGDVDVESYDMDANQVELAAVLILLILISMKRGVRCRRS